MGVSWNYPMLLWSIFLLTGTINLYLYINDVRHLQPVRNGSTQHLLHDRTVDLSCQYDNTLHFQPPKLIEVTQDGSQVSNFQVRTFIDGLNRPFIDYTLPAGQATGVHIYRCTYGGTFIQVTINFEGKCRLWSMEWCTIIHRTQLSLIPRISLRTTRNLI